MSSRDIDTSKDILLQNLQTINKSDTISQFVDKCNHNFSKIVELGGGTAGVQGEQGTQGVPVKPKVAIHAWREGSDFEYYGESTDGNGGYIMVDIYEDLTNEKYQIGHLIILQNGHVYILKENTNTFDLTPIFIFAMQSFDPNTIIDGKNSYLHIAYADNANGDNLVTDRELNGDSNEMSTFNLMRNVSNVYSNSVDEKPYMGIYSDFNEISSPHPERYAWIRVRGKDGKDGEDFTSQLFYIDLEGDMSTISLNNNRNRLYEGDYCECIAHAYYGNKRFKLNTNQVSIKSLSDEYDVTSNVTQNENETEIRIQYDGSYIGSITITQKGNDVAFRFTPDPAFSFPKNDIIFSIHVEADVNDENNPTTYSFTRDTVWAIKGIVSTFELEIIPQYKTIKLFDGGRYPEELSVFVYKTENGEREIFDFSKNRNFKLLYKNYNVNTWTEYTGAVDTKDVSCLEFKVVKNYGTENEEIWDYEDVWAVADGKSIHYYHAVLGNAESMMVLTTGEKMPVETTNHGTQYCAELRNKSGYSITFKPKFYDGSEELEVTSVRIGTNNGDTNYNGTFERVLETKTSNGAKEYTLKITKVPYGVEMIPMIIIVTAKTTEGETKSDSISFNVYISTQSDIYTLVPTASTYNTSTGKSGDTIGCDVKKNNNLIPIKELELNDLELKYVVYNNKNESNPTETSYTEPLVYGKDDDAIKDEFTASDVAIEFILKYNGNEIVRSTVPLIKDGIDGEDGNNWQYIFCRLNEYPYPYQSDKGLNQNPASWYNDKTHTDPNEEYIEEDYKEIWFDDHQGVDKKHKYEYQSYRKWNKEGKYWGPYNSPTLYSNYSEDGKSGGYSVLLSNPVAVIPVGDDWSTDDNKDIQTDSTFVYFYDNTNDISTEISIEIIKDGDETSDLFDHFNIEDENGIQKVVFNPIIENGEKIFNFGSNTPFKLPIKISYNLNKDIDGDSENDTFISTTYWTLTPIKGLEDVEIFVDKRIVNISKSPTHNFRVGYYLISTNNDKKFVSDYNSTDNIQKYKIKLTDNISNLKYIEPVSDWKSASFVFEYNKGAHKGCYVVLVESDGETIVDYTNIVSVNDGESAIHLELSQDYIPIPCNNNGNIREGFTDDISWQMILYNGNNVINDYDNIIYDITIDNVSIKNYVSMPNGTITIPNENISKIITGDTKIRCVAAYKNITYYKTLFIDFDLSPYELELNKNILTRDINLGEITDDIISLRVKYWDGEKGWVYTNKGTTVLTFKSNSGSSQFVAEFHTPSGKSYDWVINLNEITPIKKSDSNEFRISYYADNDTEKELTYETIGIVNSGLNGAKGDDGVAPYCESVDIVGYSKTKLDIDSSDWKSSLNDITSSLQPKDKIYIKNKYTWSNGTETYGITVTLAGTQGVKGDDGKSRVLFYLGSFKDGTLNDYGLYGILNDERCDYYIDWLGQAWMRTGTVVSAKVEMDGPTGDNQKNWKKAEKVGFLQAGAIHADMINTGTITTDSALVTRLKSVDVVADTITSKTIQSSEDTNPAWILRPNGSGHLANGNISWEEDGEISFGEDVSVKRVKTTDKNDNTVVEIYDNQIYINNVELTKDKQLSTTISGDNIETYYKYTFSKNTLNSIGEINATTSKTSLTNNIEGVTLSTYINSSDIQILILPNFTFNKINNMHKNLQTFCHISATINFNGISFKDSKGNTVIKVSPTKTNGEKQWGLISGAASFKKPYLRAVNVNNTQEYYDINYDSHFNATSSDMLYNYLTFSGAIKNPGTYNIYLHMPKGSLMVYDSTLKDYSFWMNIIGGNISHRTQPAPFSGLFTNGIVAQGLTTKLLINDTDIILENYDNIHYKLQISKDGIYMSDDIGTLRKLKITNKDGVRYLTLS